MKIKIKMPTFQPGSKVWIPFTGTSTAKPTRLVNAEIMTVTTDERGNVTYHVANYEQGFTEYEIYGTLHEAISFLKRTGHDVEVV
jgi:hypothetical protein